MRIFLVAGRSGSGKKEVAKFIKEFCIYKKESCVITSYGKYLKNIAEELTLGESGKNPQDRTYLQELGMTIRGINENYFTNHLEKDIAIYEKLTDNLVVNDVRMPNEIDDIKVNEDNVYSIYVVNQFKNSNLTLSEQSHITEVALESYDDFDLTLVNDDLKTLKEKVFKYLEGVFNEK